ncbi:hypothetical protein BCR42DRAFT_396973 [Absidia repens]|uniref:Uncharacterized protein n=1 Tax=Absidia repens TaxID=90262 RepID=A0A1X2I363_9FUNG|nr:hypothetical protein BCR42DRAFT_396973 [Absidia repens]
MIIGNFSNRLKKKNNEGNNRPGISELLYLSPSTWRTNIRHTMQMIDLPSDFHTSMRRRMTKRSYIKDRYSLLSLGMSDTISERLKLTEWIDNKDRSVLLYCQRHSNVVGAVPPCCPRLPYILKAIQSDLQSFLTRYELYCHFDISIEQDSRRCC